MTLSPTRHFVHYAAMGALDTLYNYLKLNTKGSQTFDKSHVQSRVSGTMSGMIQEQQR